MRVVPRAYEEINETWIADRDRFSYEGVYSDDRLRAPAGARGPRHWREVEWEQCAGAGRRGAQGAVRTPLGVLAQSVEHARGAVSAAARWRDGLGSANIDHRLRQRDFRDQADERSFPGLGMRDRRHRCARRAAGHRLEPAPRGADPRAPRAQGRAARRARQLPQSGALPILVPGGAVPRVAAATCAWCELAAVLRRHAAVPPAAAGARRRCVSAARVSDAHRGDGGGAQDTARARDLARGARRRGSRYRGAARARARARAGDRR